MRHPRPGGAATAVWRLRPHGPAVAFPAAPVFPAPVFPGPVAPLEDGVRARGPRAKWAAL
ncbi:hypothetical protein NCCP1664_04590 [Zafaria cholistanensis]|uniref:Uncharacterized protein n=1 Tax=Zafaria cholistanensis TaxID=1682741 RepID=A0A5A7NP78_9MICC|nr:hypothetical protein NCCP1664_04590 [Zafaria cholistanensis]